LHSTREAAEQLRDILILLMPYAVEVRYPDDYSMPSAEDTRQARKAAQQVHHWLKEVCPEIFHR